MIKNNSILTDINKRIYTTPDIVCIRLDNEISLQLETANQAPTLPDEPDCAVNYLHNMYYDPFNNNVG